MGRTTFSPRGQRQRISGLATSRAGKRLTLRQVNRGIRLNSSSVGVADVDEFADSGVPGQWLRQDLRDSDLEVLTVLLLDVQAAPDRLRAQLDASDNHRNVLEGAVVLAERIAADAPSLEAFRLWLRGASDGPDPESFTSLLREIASTRGVEPDDVARTYLGVLSASSGLA